MDLRRILQCYAYNVSQEAIHDQPQVPASSHRPCHMVRSLDVTTDANASNRSAIDQTSYARFCSHGFAFKPAGTKSLLLNGAPHASQDIARSRRRKAHLLAVSRTTGGESSFVM